MLLPNILQALLGAAQNSQDMKEKDLGLLSEVGTLLVFLPQQLLKRLLTICILSSLLIIAELSSMLRLSKVLPLKLSHYSSKHLQLQREKDLRLL